MKDQVKIFQGQNKDKMEIIINDWLLEQHDSIKITKTEMTPLAFGSKFILTISIWYQIPKSSNFLGLAIIVALLFALYFFVK